MRAFVIRPFGTINGINFDDVQRRLIDPALAALGIEGVTSAEFLQAGNIRQDIFQLLLAADLVLVDVSLHDASVFYQLGVRQALRRRSTLLIQNRSAGYLPFDMQTDRSVEYNPAELEASLPSLQEALRVILASEVTDSAVFRMLPGLEEQHSSRLLPVPASFSEDVQIAQHSRQASVLSLLGSEVRMSYPAWASEGLRLVGRAQFRLRAYGVAKTTFEELWRLLPTDVETNQNLATIYQHLGDLDASDQALGRVLDDNRTQQRDRAEALSLKARNIKDRWSAFWRGFSGDEAARRALTSPDLFRAYEAYRRAFHNDLDSFYPGLNAMSLLTVAIELAKRLPDDWESRFETESDAARELESLENQREKLSGAVGTSLDAARENLQETRGEDRWLEISAADYLFLTSSKPKRVAFSYQRALEGTPAFYGDVARRQLDLFRWLGVLPEKTEAVLAVFPKTSSLSPGTTPRRHAVVFISQGTAFPEAATDGVRGAIAKVVGEIKERSGGHVVGLASAAPGGDLLFHDACGGIDVESHVYLTAPVEQFRAQFSPAGRGWEDKFDALLARTSRYETLSDSGGWPVWLWGDPSYSPVERANSWLVHAALVLEPVQMTILTLSDGLQGESPGGRQLPNLAARHGAKLVTISIAEVLQAGTASMS